MSEKTGPYNRTMRLLPALLLAASVAGACDQSFDPVAPGAVPFSVFGYLDASADTQWIRVMPIRPLALTSQDPFDATVSLEHMGTGEQIQLRDSLFRFMGDPDLGSEGVFVHNFWTTRSIEPGATYRFVAERPGEAAAEAVVAIPADFDVEVGLRQAPGSQDYLELTGLPNVAFLAATSGYRSACGIGIDTVWYKGESAEDGHHMIPVAKAPVVPRGACPIPRIEKRAMWVVGSEAEWPSGDDYSVSRLGVPEGESNVDNAIGYIGGVLTKVVPYETCAFLGGGGPLPTHCVLRYGPESASISGEVKEVRCSDGPLDTATVTLTELDREPTWLRKVRSTFTNPAGQFEIDGLEAGMRYYLRVRAKPSIEPFVGEVDLHTILGDTLEFQPGEHVEYQARLERLTVCGSPP